MKEKNNQPDGKGVDQDRAEPLGTFFSKVVGNPYDIIN